MDPCGCGLEHLYRDCPTEGKKSKQAANLASNNLGAPGFGDCDLTEITEIAGLLDRFDASRRTPAA